MSEKYKRKPNVRCSVCGKDIYKRPAQIKLNNGNVFCSNGCYGVSCRKEVACLVCGKLILAGLHKKTCSRKCSNIHRTGIKYKINAPKDKVKSYQALKTRLLKIKGKNCQRCDYEKYEILQIHHKNRDHNDNRIENLELICPNCHFEEHYLEKSWLKNRKNIEMSKS